MCAKKRETNHVDIKWVINISKLLVGKVKQPQNVVKYFNFFFRSPFHTGKRRLTVDTIQKTYLMSLSVQPHNVIDTSYNQIKLDDKLLDGSPLIHSHLIDRVTTWYI